MRVKAIASGCGDLNHVRRVQFQNSLPIINSFLFYFCFVVIHNTIAIVHSPAQSSKLVS